MGSTSDLEIAKPITLKSGLTLPNRLVKAAMAENMAPGNHLPSEKLLKVYEKWAAGGWGMVLTGMSYTLINTHSSPLTFTPNYRFPQHTP